MYDSDYATQDDMRRINDARERQIARNREWRRERHRQNGVDVAVVMFVLALVFLLLAVFA